MIIALPVFAITAPPPPVRESTALFVSGLWEINTNFSLPKRIPASLGFLLPYATLRAH